MTDPVFPEAFPNPNGWYKTPGISDDVSGVVCFSVKLPDHRAFFAAFHELVSRLANPDAWHNDETGITPEAAAELYASVTMKGLSRGETCMIGQIILWPGLLANMPSELMECNGQALDKTEYPDLFATIGYIWGGSGNTFNLPDLRHRAVIGASSAFGSFTSHPLAWSGGAETHTLTNQQLSNHTHSLPTHTHTTANHNHTQDPHHHAYDPVVFPDLDLESAGFPQGNAAQVIPLITENTYDATATNQSASVTVNANASGTSTGTAGGGQAHNNMQPSAALYYAIYVR